MRMLAKVIVALMGWMIALCWGYLYLTGGGKGVADYAINVVRESQVIPATSTDVVWSGWWPPTDGFRWNNSMRPDIAFVWQDGDRKDCGFRIVAFPFRLPQRLFWRINSGAWNTDIKIDHDAEYELRGSAHLVNGTNLLTFRLPDAQIAGNSDTRLLSIGVRQLAVICGGSVDNPRSEKIFADSP